jgi:hypothetical protein
MTDEARKIHTARATGLLGYEEPDAHCLPQGVPKINMAPVPFRIVQTEKLVPASELRTLEIDITITDPTYYTKPWTATPKLRLVPDTELFEFICNENEKSRQHMGPHISGPPSR